MIYFFLIIFINVHSGLAPGTWAGPRVSAQPIAPGPIGMWAWPAQGAAPDLRRRTLSQLLSELALPRPDPHTCLLLGADMFLWFTLLAGLAVPLAALFSKLFPHFLDDCVYILRSVGFGIRLTKYKRTRPFYSIVDRFLDASAKHPGKPFLLFEGREYSYGDVDRQSNKVGRALQAAAGLQEGATVALFLANEPSLVWTWLGLAKLGCTVALLNFNIRSKSLLHCFSCCGAKVIITSAGKTLVGAPDHAHPPLPRPASVSVNRGHPIRNSQMWGIGSPHGAPRPVCKAKHPAAAQGPFRSSDACYYGIT